MTAERWRRLKEIVQAARERDTGERAALLDQACAEDAELRGLVETLLASDENIGEFLAPPAMDIARAQAAGLSPIADLTEDSLIQVAAARALEHLPGDTRAASELIGASVGRYRITGLIGKGGMGAVYRAEREDDFRMQVAIKLVKRGMDTDAAVGRFPVERQILAGLQHPNIARLLDGGATQAGLPYFVMEYVDGTPLLEYAAPFPVRQRLELFRSVCSAVQYAHENLIVHRDIKPANILVTRDGIPKLLDFGIAKLLDPTADDTATSLTAAGARVMTPAYASPEQVLGRQVTKASDIYSLGAVRSGCPGTTARRWRRLEYDESCLAEKDRRRPCQRDSPKWPLNGHLRRPNRQGFFGLTRKPAKVFRVGLYARVSTNDHETIPLEVSSTLREYVLRRGWTIALQMKEVSSALRVHSSLLNVLLHDQSPYMSNIE